MDEDVLGPVWGALTEVRDLKRSLRGLKAMDELREILADQGARGCCTTFDRALDGTVRCLACGRVLGMERSA